MNGESAPIMDEFINALLKLGKEDWVALVIIGSAIYKLFCNLIGVERIKIANQKFVEIMEKVVQYNLTRDIDFSKIENIVKIISKKYDVNRDCIMSYSFALNKATFNCMKEVDFKYEEIMRFGNAYDNLKICANDMDKKISNTNRMIYLKGYLLATTVFF